MMKGKKTSNSRFLLWTALAILLACGTICTVVADVSLDPGIFMQDDQGTLTVRITNSGTSPPDQVTPDRSDLLQTGFPEPGTPVT
jgi:hypothetical protein